jgi:HEAT repeat protein
MQINSSLRQGAMALVVALTWTLSAWVDTAFAAGETVVGAPGDPLDSLITEALAGSKPATDTLATLGDPRATPRLTALIAQHPEKKQLQQAYWVLVALKDPRSRELFLQGLGSQDPVVRTASAWGLVPVATRADMPRLVALLASDEAPLREAAAWALGNLDEPGAVEPLLPLIEDPDPGLRAAALASLEKLGGPFRQLIRQSLAGDWQARAALAKGNDPRALAPLIRLLDDGDGRTRRAAAASLGYLRSAAADRALVRMAGRWNWLDRSAASRALFATDHGSVGRDLGVAARLLILPSTLGYLGLLGLLIALVARLLRH